MAAPRFYCPQPVQPGTTLELPDALAHHVRVLRLAEGDPVVLFDGRGGEIPGRVRFEGKAGSVQIEAGVSQDADD